MTCVLLELSTRHTLLFSSEGYFGLFSHAAQGFRHLSAFNVAFTKYLLTSFYASTIIGAEEATWNKTDKTLTFLTYVMRK